VNLSYDHSITLPPSSLQRKEIVEVEIFADRSKISQVLRNFISNALKFTPTGGHVSIVQKFIPHIANSSSDAIISDNRISSMVREVRSRVSSSAVFVTNVEVDDIETTPNGTLRVEVHDTGHGISRVRSPPSLTAPHSVSSGKSRKTFQIGHSIRYGGSPRRQGLRLGFI
jgi:signal transduction histidine kinase